MAKNTSHVHKINYICTNISLFVCCHNITEKDRHLIHVSYVTTSILMRERTSIHRNTLKIWRDVYPCKRYKSKIVSNSYYVFHIYTKVECVLFLDRILYVRKKACVSLSISTHKITIHKALHKRMIYCKKKILI